MAFDDAFPTPASTLSTMTQWESLFVGGFAGAAGVVGGKGGELALSINSGARTVSVASGSAMVRGFYSNNPSTYTASVPAQSVADRVDRMVLRLDRTAVTAANWIKPTIIQGSSGSATPPAVQTGDSGSWDLMVGRWTTKADGTLTGAVDERPRLGGGFLVFKSGARPAASPPRIGYEEDTQRLLFADGTSWSAIIPDTGWMTLAGTGFWQAGTLVPRVRRVGAVVYMRGNFVRTNEHLVSGSPPSPVSTLPVGFAPAEQHNWMAWTATGGARVQVDTDASMHIIDVTETIPVGNAVYVDTTWLVG